MWRERGTSEKCKARYLDRPCVDRLYNVGRGPQIWATQKYWRDAPYGTACRLLAIQIGWFWQRFARHLMPIILVTDCSVIVYDRIFMREHWAVLVMLSVKQFVGVTLRCLRFFWVRSNLALYIFCHIRWRRARANDKIRPDAAEWLHNRTLARGHNTHRWSYIFTAVCASVGSIGVGAQST